MRFSMMIGQSAALLLLAVLCMSAVQSRAQNQTPANDPMQQSTTSSRIAPQAIDNDNVWNDPETGLMWTRKDDGGKGMDWSQAKSYCANLRLEGFSDWRLPEIQELAAIYDRGSTAYYHSLGMRIAYHIKGNIQLSGYSALWSNTVGKSSDQAYYFGFDRATQFSYKMSHSMGLRALCVRR
ncbi:MAG: DUF1566 domain-containing protein [Terracidiphilus sp.]